VLPSTTSGGSKGAVAGQNRSGGDGAGPPPTTTTTTGPPLPRLPAPPPGGFRAGPAAARAGLRRRGWRPEEAPRAPAPWPARAGWGALGGGARPAAALRGPPAASADGRGTAGSQPPVVTVPAPLPATPYWYSVDASTAINKADEDPIIERLRRRLGPLSAVPPGTPDHWGISAPKNGEPLGLVFRDSKSPHVQEAWTGDQVVWPMARGYEGQFGHILNAPYVWIPLALIFFLGLFDLRRPGRLAHLDLLALLSFGISQVYFNYAAIGVSAPLVYIPLVYLFARMVWIGFKGRGSGLRPT